MRLIVRLMLVVSSFVFAAAVSIAAIGPAQHEHPATQQHPETGAHHHPEAAQIKNPVPADATSVAAGREVFTKHCAECHGDTGKGDGEMGAEYDPKPADLTDAEWKHGSTDGEIFVVIRDGVKNTGMNSFSKKLTAHQMWDVVNYIRSIGPKPSH